MTASRSHAARGMDVMLALASLSIPAAMIRAQPPALAPTANTTIFAPMSGALHYSSIDVPAGVTVQFRAPGAGGTGQPGKPAIVLCDGDAIVHGTLFLAGDNLFGRPAGFVTTGAGELGQSCGLSGFFPPGFPPGGGLHAGSYGSVLPFSLEGGSRGGDVRQYANNFGGNCGGTTTLFFGGEGGGTLVLLAGGRIDVHGTITADGGFGYSGGSGGSILLRGDDGVVVHPGASVTARGGGGLPAPAPWPPEMSNGAPGYVRLDAWGTAPVIQGTIDPPPTVLELPHLRSASPPTIGVAWTLDVFAPEGAWVYVAASLAPASGSPMTPFGPLGLDLATTADLGTTFPQPSHDPVASVTYPIPNTATLIGFPLWVQAIAVPPGLSARLTNTLAVVVQ